MSSNMKEVKLGDQSALITFLQLTKEGRYAKIDEASLIYARLTEEREESYDEENYYYGIS
jgi:hypothetical protein